MKASHDVLNKGVGKTPYTGVDDFKVISDKSNLYVDKTLFIPDFVESKEGVTLITRPRRFSKSTNMSMLTYFLSNHPDNADNLSLFEGFAIAEDVAFCKQHQGQSPVIFLSLKGIEEDTFDLALHKVRNVIADLYENYRYLHDNLATHEKKLFTQYINGQADQSHLEDALKNLCKFLFKYHKKKVYILIDEYDAPLNHACMMSLSIAHQLDNQQRKQKSQDYIHQLSLFLKNFLGAALKSNVYLEKGLMTGILRLSKNAMLSSLNNLECYGMLDKRYGDHFGFTKVEVIKALEESELSPDKLAEIKTWYNGYTIGPHVMYNPWSVMKYIKYDGEPIAYWVRTGGVDSIIQQMLFAGSHDTKSLVRQLISQDKSSMLVDVSEAIIFENLLSSVEPLREKALWTLLLCSGYLTASDITPTGLSSSCTLAIPNHEIYLNFVEIFSEWLMRDSGLSQNHAVLQALCAGDVERFTEEFGQYLLTATSLRDFQAEADYQALLIGLFSLIEARYHVKSNREGGVGFPDFILVPKTSAVGDLGFVLELKHLGRDKKPTLIARKAQLELLARDEALGQIDEKHYASELTGYAHVKRVVKIGLAFSGKMLVCAYCDHSIDNPRDATEVQLCYGFNESQLRPAKSTKQKRVKRQSSDERLYLPAKEVAEMGFLGSKKAKTRMTKVEQMAWLDESSEENEVDFSQKKRERPESQEKQVTSQHKKVKENAGSENSDDASGDAQMLRELSK